VGAIVRARERHVVTLWLLGAASTRWVVALDRGDVTPRAAVADKRAALVLRAGLAVETITCPELHFAVRIKNSSAGAPEDVESIPADAGVEVEGRRAGAGVMRSQEIVRVAHQKGAVP